MYKSCTSWVKFIVKYFILQDAVVVNGIFLTFWTVHCEFIGKINILYINLLSWDFLHSEWCCLWIKTVLLFLFQCAYDTLGWSFLFHCIGKNLHYYAENILFLSAYLTLTWKPVSYRQHILGFCFLFSLTISDVWLEYLLLL